MIKNASELLALGALKTAEVTVCGAKLRIREMSVGAWRKIAEAKDARTSACLMVQLCAIGPDGSPLFSAEQSAELEDLRPEVIDGIASEILKLSGIKEEGPKKG